MEKNGENLSAVLRILGDMTPAEQDWVFVYIRGIVDGKRLNEAERKKADTPAEKEE